MLKLQPEHQVKDILTDVIDETWLNLAWSILMLSIQVKRQQNNATSLDKLTLHSLNDSNDLDLLNERKQSTCPHSSKLN